MRKTTKIKLWRAGFNVAWFILGFVCATSILKDHYDNKIWEMQIKFSNGGRGAFYPNLETREVEFRWAQ